MSPISIDKESKKSGQTTLFFYYRRVISSLLNSSNPGFPRRANMLFISFNTWCWKRVDIVQVTWKGNCHNSKKKIVSKSVKVLRSGRVTHVWYITICVWARNTVSVYILFKVNASFLKVTKCVKVFFPKVGISTFLRFVNTGTTVSNMTRIPSWKLTKRVQVSWEECWSWVDTFLVFSFWFTPANSFHHSEKYWWWLIKFTKISVA